MLSRIIINSHSESSIALNHLLDSLKLDIRNKNYNIMVFIGGNYHLTDYEITTIDNITYIKCNYNSIDYTSFIALSELYADQIDNIYLYLHDTCKVGTSFFDKLEKINFNNVTSIKLNKPFSNNIGFYTQKLINQYKLFLQEIKITKPISIDFKKYIVSLEDKIFNEDCNNIILDNYNGWKYTGPTDYYNTGTMRIVEHYPNLDLYKIKANWGQGVWTINY